MANGKQESPNLKMPVGSYKNFGRNNVERFTILRVIEKNLFSPSRLRPAKQIRRTCVLSNLQYL